MGAGGSQQLFFFFFFGVPLFLSERKLGGDTLFGAFKKAVKPPHRRVTAIAIPTRGD